MKTNKEIRQLWKQSVGNNPTARDMVYLCLLKAFHAKSNDKTAVLYGLLRKTFTPITNKNRLANGHAEFGVIRENLRYIDNVFANVAWKKSDSRLILAFGKTGFSDIFDTVEEAESFMIFVRDFYKSFDTETLKRYYCYVFLDIESVSPEQLIVQSAHVTMVVGKNMPDNLDPHNIFYQIVELPNGMTHDDLVKKYKNFKFHQFVEPDMGNRVVASAIEPILWCKRQPLRKFPLVKISA